MAGAGAQHTRFACLQTASGGLSLRFISDEELTRALSYNALIDAIEQAFRDDINVPKRHHHTLARPGADATLLLMPAWSSGYLGCKIVSVFPDNAWIGRPSVYGTYLLASAETGEPLAAMNGTLLTAWRTAAASALAARYLARKDASRLLVIGAGALAPHLVKAHKSARNIVHVTIWNRTPENAITLSERLADEGHRVSVADDLENAVRSADIISCATLSTEPLIRGNWLAPGAHVDLVGAFTPEMRETDDVAVTKALLYVDTRAGGLSEAGDIVNPLRRGIIAENDIRGDLFDLCRGAVPGREDQAAITLFKSVGTGIEDLAAAMLVWRRVAGLEAA